MNMKKLYEEYLNYTDPIIGADEGLEICYSDVYGYPLHDVTFEEYKRGMR